MDPPPIAFIEKSPEALSEERMREAITYGKENTAMMSFSAILSEQEIDDVIHFVRETFIHNKKENTKYHTEENGWYDHDRGGR